MVQFLVKDVKLGINVKTNGGSPPLHLACLKVYMLQGCSLSFKFKGSVTRYKG